MNQELVRLKKVNENFEKSIKEKDTIIERYSVLYNELYDFYLQCKCKKQLQKKQASFQNVTPPVIGDTLYECTPNQNEVKVNN